MGLNRGTETVRQSGVECVGEVFVDVLAAGDDLGPRISFVSFAPGARTAWHRYPGGQALFGTDGVGLLQVRGGARTEILTGMLLRITPDEWHWHGSAPGHFLAHLAVTSPSNGAHKWIRPDRGRSRSRTGLSALYME